MWIKTHLGLLNSELSPLPILESEYIGYLLLFIYNTNQGKHFFIYIYFLYAKQNKEKNFIVVATTVYFTKITT